MRVGVLGGGQLAMMLAQAAPALGVELLCFVASEDCPAASVSPLFVGSLDQPSDIEAFCQQVDVVTFENEFIDPEVIDQCMQYAAVCPNKNSIATAQDRLLEKQFFEKSGVPVTAYHNIESLDDMLAAFKTLGKGILKSRTLGYDGKGQCLVESEAAAKAAFEHLGGRPLIYEQFIAFDCEVSILAARNERGDIVFYPLTENQHQQGILRESRAPFEHHDLWHQAKQYAQDVLQGLEYVGLLAIEFFVVADCLVANEMAPRVHNSGHWTIEGANNSQFEVHLRAITNMRLPEIEVTTPTFMFNIIGTHVVIESLESVFFHDYNKAARPGRKLAHVTVTSPVEADHVRVKLSP